MDENKRKHLKEQAKEYAENYPGDISRETRLAVYRNHLAHLINQEIKGLREFAQMCGLVEIKRPRSAPHWA